MADKVWFLEKMCCFLACSCLYFVFVTNTIEVPSCLIVFENSQTSRVNIFRSQQLTPKQSRWNNSIKGNWRNMICHCDSGRRLPFKPSTLEDSCLKMTNLVEWRWSFLLFRLNVYSFCSIMLDKSGHTVFAWSVFVTISICGLPASIISTICCRWLWL